MSRDDGGSAFPAETLENLDFGSRRVFYPGMSLRDYFAAKAMQALIIARGHEIQSRGGWPIDAEKIAWTVADAMLTARSKP